MAVTVRKGVLWRGSVENRPGALAELLEPIATQGADLQVVMGYHETGERHRAVIELYPVTGKKLTGAAQLAGLSPARIPAVMVSGSNRAGLAHRVARAIAEAGLNISFLVAQSLGSRYSAVFGFETESDVTRAMAVIRKAGG
jgi:hypothetical protein